MAIDKLPEFAKTGQKNTDHLNLTDGFPVSKKPARQWFNWLFNTLTSKVNEIIDADFIPKTDIVNNLTTDDAKKPVSAKQAKALQDTKLGKTENAASATNCSRSVIAGNGLSGGGVLTANRTLTLGTPTKITSSSTNSVTTTSHTHEIDNASTSVAGVVQLNNTLTSTSTTQALTAAQGKGLQDNKLGKSENAVSATNCSRQVIAGNGLSGGGLLNANRTLTLGTPGTITASTGNTVSASSHTHNLDVNSLPFLGTGINKRKSIISGTTYTNTGNRPIFVTCSMSGSSSNAASATLDGRLIFSTKSSNQYSTSFVVGVGVSYSFTGNALVCEEYS